MRFSEQKYGIDRKAYCVIAHTHFWHLDLFFKCIESIRGLYYFGELLNKLSVLDLLYNLLSYDYRN